MLLPLILLRYLIILEGSRNVKWDARNSGSPVLPTQRTLEDAISRTTHEEEEALEETRPTALTNWNLSRSPSSITYTPGGIISISSLLNPVKDNENSEKTIPASPNTLNREQMENSLPTPWWPRESTQGSNLHQTSDESNNWGGDLPKSLPEPSSKNSMNQYQDGSSSLIRIMPEITARLCSEKDQSNELPPTVNSPSSVTTHNNNYGVSATNYTHDQPKQRLIPNNVNYDCSQFINYVPKQEQGSTGLSREEIFPLKSLGVPFEEIGEYYQKRNRGDLHVNSIGEDREGSLGYHGSPRQIGQITWRYSFDSLQTLGRDLTATKAYIAQSKQSMLLTASTQSILICNIPLDSTEQFINLIKCRITRALDSLGNTNGASALQALERIPDLSYIYLLQQNIHIFRRTNNVHAVLFSSNGQAKVIPQQDRSILEAQSLVGQHICLIKVKEEAGLHALLKSFGEYIISSKAPENWSLIGNPEEVILCAHLVERSNFK